MANKNLKIKAYETIKNMVINNEIEQGQYLDDKKLCEKLGISRTPIREALVMLELEDLVHTIPNKGTYVTTMSVQSVKELFKIRHIIEPIILEMAFDYLDMDILLKFKVSSLSMLENKDYQNLHILDYDFHEYIASKCNNYYLKKIQKNLADNFQRVRTQPFYAKERTETGAQEHLQLIEFLLQGDKERAIALVGAHISSTERFYFQSLI